MTEVFVAYARQDAAVAQRLARTLNDRGISAWIDADAPDARAFAATLADRLRRADAVLALWTRAGAASPFVRAEAREGLESARLINLRSPDAPLNPPAPFDRSGFDVFDLPTETDPDAEDRWESLVDLILDASQAYVTWRKPKGAPAAPDPTAARARAASFVRDMEAHPDARWTPILNPDGDGFSRKSREAFSSAVYSLACAIDPRWRRALARLGARESRLLGVYEIEDLARRTEPGSAWRRVAGAAFWPLYPVRALSAFAQSGASDAQLDALVAPRLFIEYRPVRTGRPVPPSPLGQGARRKGGGVEPAWWAWPASLAAVIAVGVLFAGALGAGQGVRVNEALLPAPAAGSETPTPERELAAATQARPDGASTTRPARAPERAPSVDTDPAAPIEGTGGGGAGRSNTAADVLFELSRRTGAAGDTANPIDALSREDVERLVDDALARAGKPPLPRTEPDAGDRLDTARTPDPAPETSDTAARSEPIVIAAPDAPDPVAPDQAAELKASTPPPIRVDASVRPKVEPDPAPAEAPDAERKLASLDDRPPNPRTPTKDVEPTDEPRPAPPAEETAAATTTTPKAEPAPDLPPAREPNLVAEPAPTVNAKPEPKAEPEPVAKPEPKSQPETTRIAAPVVGVAPSGWLGVEGERLAALCPRVEPVVHCVRQGETLFRLAERFYGAGCGDLYGVILERNRDVFDAPGRNGDPDLILPGDKLIVPAWPDRGAETSIAPASVSCPG